MTLPINIYVIDDHTLFLDGLVSLLENNKDVKIIGKAKSGNEALKKINDSVNVVLTDVQMPEMNGIELAKKIKTRIPNTKIIAISSNFNFLHSNFQDYFDGYLLKNTGKIELLTAIKKVNNGITYYSDSVKEIMNDSISKKYVDENMVLSEREIEIIRLIAKEKNTVEISEKLNISINTVESHRKNLIRKTGAKNMIGLALFAIKNQLV